MMSSKYALPTVFAVGDASSHTPTVFSAGGAGGPSGLSPERSCQLILYVTKIAPAASSASGSGTLPITAGLRPAGVDGICSRTVIHPSSIVASRTSAAGSGGATAGTGGGAGRAHAASTAKTTASIVRAAALVVLASACTSRPLVARAIHARGGPLRGIVREVEADVYAGFPGTWRWRTAFLLPTSYAWSIYTAGAPDHYLFDGGAARAFVGDREVS